MPAGRGIARWYNGLARPIRSRVALDLGGVCQSPRQASGVVIASPKTNLGTQRTRPPGQRSKARGSRPGCPAPLEFERRDRARTVSVALAGELDLASGSAAQAQLARRASSLTGWCWRCGCRSSIAPACGCCWRPTHGCARSARGSSSLTAPDGPAPPVRPHGRERTPRFPGRSSQSRPSRPAPQTARRRAPPLAPGGGPSISA